METVVSCTKMKEVQGRNGQPVAIYAIGLSDGQGGESFGVMIPVGTKMEDLVIEASQYGNKIKLKKAANAGGGWGGGKRGGNESFALSYAKDLVVAGKVDIKEILTCADRFIVWLDSKKTS